MVCIRGSLQQSAAVKELTKIMHHTLTKPGPAIKMISVPLGKIKIYVQSAVPLLFPTFT